MTYTLMIEDSGDYWRGVILEHDGNDVRSVCDVYEVAKTYPKAADVLANFASFRNPTLSALHDDVDFGRARSLKSRVARVFASFNA